MDALSGDAGIGSTCGACASCRTGGRGRPPPSPTSPPRTVRTSPNDSALAQVRLGDLPRRPLCGDDQPGHVPGELLHLLAGLVDLDAQSPGLVTGTVSYTITTGPVSPDASDSTVVAAPEDG